jgi:hypothetical protein
MSTRMSGIPPVADCFMNEFGVYKSECTCSNITELLYGQKCGCLRATNLIFILGALIHKYSLEPYSENMIRFLVTLRFSYDN